ncbi:MAG: transporter substrate-binding domain-containing protein [Symploca sp. SIO2B6]|nr:transporter substrate-binding domain-containing protein [Symploca sp. SIO2B6]
MPNFYTLFRCITFTLILGGGACSSNPRELGRSNSDPQGLGLPQSLTMITTPNYCPYEFIGAEGEPVGFDIALAEALATELGYGDANGRSFQIQTTQHFNSIMPQLVQQDIDFAMAAITPTRARQRIVDFSEIYYVQKIALVSRYDQPFTNLGTLVGKQVGITADSAHADRLSQYSSIDLINQFDNTKALIEAIKRRYVDAGVIDAAIAPKYVSPSSRLQVHPVEPLSETAGVAIAFPPGSPLISQFNRALATLREQGTIQQLIYDWFDDYQCPNQEDGGS